MRDLLSIILKFWIEILIGLIILYGFDDLKLFLFYFFILFIVLVYRHMDYLRKLIRLANISSEIKALTILRKLKTTNDEILIVTEEEKRKIGEEKWKQIEKELEDLI